MLRTNAVKARLRAGEVVYGAIVGPDPMTAEILAEAGFDFIQVDGEHYSIDAAALEAVVRACDAAGTVTFARLATHDPRILTPYLETVVLGLQVAQCSTPEDARLVVAAAKYPPIGERGVGPGRAQGYGRVPQVQHIQEWNAEMLAVVQVEDPRGLANLPAILEVPGVDSIAIGLADLVLSMGHPGERDHPEVWRALVYAVKQIRDAGLSCAVAGVSDPARYVDIGVQVFKYGAATLLRERALAVLAEARGT